MQLFLTSVLPFLAHDHASAVAFLTCRHHNFHASIIPEFLSDEERVRSFCEARQQNRIKTDTETQYKNLYYLFVQTPLQQFSPSLIVFHQGHSPELIVKRLLETKYFSRTLQRCSLFLKVKLNRPFLKALSKVQSLTKLDLGIAAVENQHLEIIINSFPSLEILTTYYANCLEPKRAINIASPPPPATKTLRSLTMYNADPLFATQFIPHFINLRNLVLRPRSFFGEELDLLPLSCSLPLLKDIYLGPFILKNSESLKNLAHLSTLEFSQCCNRDSLSFLAQENGLPHLTTLRIESRLRVPIDSFASLYHAPNLHVLKVTDREFNNGCLQYLDNMIHLRNLDLSYTSIVGDSRLLKFLMQNLFNLEELNLGGCNVGNQGAIAGALYSTHSRLRVLNLSYCNLVDDDLNGIGALKNMLEFLDLSGNRELTSEALVHCKDLMKLKTLELDRCLGIGDLSPLKDCLNLEELDLCWCQSLTDDSFKVFSEESNSFPNLRILNLSYCPKLTEKVLEHLANNIHLVYQLKELSTWGMAETFLLSSATTRNRIYQLKGLRRLSGILDSRSESDRNERKVELIRSLKNIEEID